MCEIECAKRPTILRDRRRVEKFFRAVLPGLLKLTVAFTELLMLFDTLLSNV